VVVWLCTITSHTDKLEPKRGYTIRGSESIGRPIKLRLSKKTTPTLSTRTVLVLVLRMKIELQAPNSDLKVEVEDSSSSEVEYESDSAESR
jgi:hypothetical protein